MLISMTGYSSINEKVHLPQAGALSLTVEIKTLNGRFFEVVSRLPSTLSHLELPISSLLQEKLIRGRIYINIRLGESEGGLSSVIPSWHTIDQYIGAADAIKNKYGLKGELALVDLMNLPNVFVAQESSLTPEDEKVILALVDKGANAVFAMRKEEGNRLERDFKKMFQVCAEKVATIEKASQLAVEQQKELIRQTLAQVPHPSHTEQQNSHLVEEQQIALKKMDIHEEITRFKSHLESVGPFLSSPALEKGKRLDFILQELLRETNTMMAKCQAYQVSASCIDIKVELEKAREQIQNIV